MDSDENRVKSNVALVEASEVPQLLSRIRPAWQAKNLILRVRSLIPIDPSSACQRLFNAAVHDLREKIVVAGVDIAREAAKQNRLPVVDKADDVENYSTNGIIDLAYRIGLLTRPEWRRLSRCYEIRRDLEHEDDEYEAGVEDCVYIFKTCIEVVLARDPVHLLRVADVKEVVEQPAPSLPAQTLLEDYRSAPPPRQEEILKFLISIALNAAQSEIVQQNAFNCLVRLEPLTQASVKLAIAGHMQGHIGKSAFSRRDARVAYAAGILPYLKRANLIDCFGQLYGEMAQVGSAWRAYAKHGDLLRSFAELGGLNACPPEVRGKILRWMVLTYVGEKGGRTSFGHVRPVFFSNTAAPIIEELIKASAPAIASDLRALAKERDVAALLTNQHLARRFELLLDLVEVDGQ